MTQRAEVMSFFTCSRASSETEYLLSAREHKSVHVSQSFRPLHVSGMSCNAYRELWVIMRIGDDVIFDYACKFLV